MMSRLSLRFAVVSLVLVAAALPVSADVQLPALFTDHMVIQRDMPIHVWGTAAPDEKVTVTLGDRSATATADKDGAWRVTLDKMDAGGPFELTAKASNAVTVKDVLVGEVWVCSGQSNMNMPIDWGVFGAWGTPECAEALKKIDDPQLRMFLVDTNGIATPQKDVAGTWMIAKNTAVLKWSAAAYFFGVELRRELGVPVGLVKTSVGGTLIESWTSREALIGLDSDHYKPIFDRRDRAIANFDEEAFKKKLEDWEAAAAKAKEEGKKAPAKPVSPAGGVRGPSVLYNGMVAPLIPYTIRGFIWYQGESNVHNAVAYSRLFPNMIRDWRSRWGEGDIPFLFVQLANFQAAPKEPGDSNWAELREAQRLTLSEPNTAMAVIIDVGEANDIHPKNKQDVGRRLGLAAMKLAYGRDIVYSGPLYKDAAIKDGAVRVTFTNTGGGMVTRDGNKLTGFAIAGEDKEFVWADARIDGDAVVVSSSEVANPVAVRYAWANNPPCNLYNKEGLPASPFRTDDWPLSTQDKK